MASVADTLVQAWQAYEGGDQRRAALLGLDVLRAEPNQPAALGLLGGICLAVGDVAEAARYYERALQASPEDAGCQNSLGVALLRQGRIEEALPRFREAMRLAPQAPEAFNNMAMALRQYGRLDEARDCLQQALHLFPGSADAHFNLALLLQAEGKPVEAAASYGEAIRLRPDYAEAHCMLGSLLKEAGKLDEAESNLRRAAELKPGWAEPVHHLGLLLQMRGNLAESESVLRQATRLGPDYLAYNNLGVSLAMQGKVEEAVANFRHALRLNPQHADAYINLGNLLREVAAFEEAQANLEQAIRLKPGCAEAHYALALLLLLQGDFQRGWAGHEACWQLETPIRPRRHARKPLWDGSDLSGRTILLYAEHAHGDTLQFIRYAGLVKERGGAAATVLLECQPRLVRLLSRCGGIHRIFAEGAPLPDFDVQAPLMCLPLIFGTTATTIPAPVPYLSAESELVEVWRRELAPLEGFKIGIAWQGDPRHYTDLTRSIPIERFAPLAMLNGVRLLSLQKGVGREQLPAFAAHFPIIDLGGRLDETTGGFVETAAVVKNLDLVITSDTGLAHLAGALGVPVWVALAFVPEWRWLLKRTDSPWYPTMRLFRQARRGDWDGVFDQMAAEVAKLVTRKSAGDRAVQGAERCSLQDSE